MQSDAPNQVDPKVVLDQADRLGFVNQAMLRVTDVHPAAVMVLGARLFLFGAAGAGLPKDANTFKAFLEGFPGILPNQEAPKPSIIIPSEAEVAEVAG